MKPPPVNGVLGLILRVTILLESGIRRNFFSIQSGDPAVTGTNQPVLQIGEQRHFEPLSSNDVPLRGPMLAGSSLRHSGLVSQQNSENMETPVITAVAGVRNTGCQLQRLREAVAASEAACMRNAKGTFGCRTDCGRPDTEYPLTSVRKTNSMPSYALTSGQLRFDTGAIEEPYRTTQRLSGDVFLMGAVPEPAGQKRPPRRDRIL